MALQLGGTIAIGAFIGRKLDEYFELDKPLLTALLALLATVGAIYLLVNGLINIKVIVNKSYVLKIVCTSCSA
jgi:hypothetical protein